MFSGHAFQPHDSAEARLRSDHILYPVDIDEGVWGQHESIAYSLSLRAVANRLMKLDTINLFVIDACRKLLEPPDRNGMFHDPVPPLVRPKAVISCLVPSMVRLRAMVYRMHHWDPLHRQC